MSALNEGNQAPNNKLMLVLIELVSTFLLITILFIIICVIKKHKKEKSSSSNDTTINEDFHIEKEIVNDEYKYEKDPWI